MKTTLTLLLLAACAGSTTEGSAAPQPAAATVPVAPAKPATPTPTPPPAAAPAAPASPGTAGDVASGAAVYTQYCQACHQADGTGMNGMLAANFVKDPARLQKSDEELLGSIRNGVSGKVGTMPPWGGTLTDQQQRDVLAYVRATFGQGTGE